MLLVFSRTSHRNRKARLAACGLRLAAHSDPRDVFTVQVPALRTGNPGSVRASIDEHQFLNILARVREKGPVANRQHKSTPASCAMELAVLVICLKLLFPDGENFNYCSVRERDCICDPSNEDVR